MTYILTDEELQALISKSENTPNVLSPITEKKDSISKILWSNSDYKLKGLEKMNLVDQDSESKKFKLTKEATFLAKALTNPESVAILYRSNSFDNKFYCLKISNVWIVYTKVFEYKLNIIISYFSNITLESWINEQFIDKVKKDITPKTQIDMQLTYDEWYLWLNSQFIYMKRDLLKSSIKSHFEISELKSKPTIDYMTDSLKSLGQEKTAQNYSEMFSNISDKRIVYALKGMVKKELITLSTDDKQHFLVNYNEIAIEWLDNEMLTDTIVFNLKTEQKDNTVAFQLRRTGLCAIYDSGKFIKLLSLKYIPWRSYLS